jgi:hypothetical protein
VTPAQPRGLSCIRLMWHMSTLRSR